MAAGLDVDVEAVVHHRAAVAVLGGLEGEARQTVDLGHELRVALDGGHILLDLSHQIPEDAALDGQDALFGSHDGLLVLLQLRCDVALRIDQSLLADPVLRHFVGVGVAHFEVISEDVVVAYLEAADAGAFALGGLDVQKDLLAVRQRVAEIVQLLVHPFCYDFSLAQLGRGLRSHGALYQVTEGAASVHPGAEGCHLLKLRSEIRDLGDAAKSVGQG